VSTFKGWRNVTLVGTPSNGRSGNSRAFELTNSGIPARISTMASFQKTGDKYDNVGIAPDIHMEAEISDWLGRSDTILDRVYSLVVQATE
jgi:C-terminal processing protease CtpA/Prc